MADGPQALHHRIKQGAQDAGSRDFELAPQLALGTPLRISDGCQGQKNRGPQDPAG